MEVRNDIYPKLEDTPWESRGDAIQTRINESFNVIKNIFRNKDDFIDYINKIESAKYAELFIDILNFYDVAKNSVKYIFVKIIMIISCIEKLSNEKHISFDDWLLRYDKTVGDEVEKNINDVDDLEQKFKNTIKSLKIKYEYGSSRKVREFLLKYMDIDEKIELIKSFELKRFKRIHKFSPKPYGNKLKKFPPTIEELAKLTNLKIDEAPMPLCYNWRQCYVDWGCDPKIYCHIKEDPDDIKEPLEKVINFIYKMRSDFVHNARIPSLCERDIHVVFDEYRGDIIQIKLKIERFEEMFEKCINKFFDEKLKQKKKK